MSFAPLDPYFAFFVPSVRASTLETHHVSTHPDPVDFTEKNSAALAAAMQIAEQSRSKVVLIHVIELIEHMPREELSRFYSKLEEHAREQMKGLADAFMKGTRSGRTCRTASGPRKLCDTPTWFRSI